MLALKSVGEVILKLVNTVITKFEKNILGRPVPKQVQTKSAVILFLLMLLTIFVIGLLQISVKVNLLQRVYFAFVTCSTIGFGDYIPFQISRRIDHLPVNGSNDAFNDGSNDAFKEKKQGPDVFYALSWEIEVIFGLCLVSSVLNSIMAAMEERKWHYPGCIPGKTREPVDIMDPAITTQQQGVSDLANKTLVNVACQTET